MADSSSKTDDPRPTDPQAFDFTLLPDYDNDFIDPKDIIAFEQALNAPDPSPSQDDLSNSLKDQPPQFITALNDWRPVRQRVRKRKKRTPRRDIDEVREGYLYGLLKWPFLATVFGWMIFLCISYMFTRFYIFLYENCVTWRGRREQLRQSLRNQDSYEDWIKAANELDAHLGTDAWKTKKEYAYYDAKTIERAYKKMVKCRRDAEANEDKPLSFDPSILRPVDELRALVEACIQDNFRGFENPKLYSETYFGTKTLVQSFIDEAETSLSFLKATMQLDADAKREMWTLVERNFGRSALCLSGGATFAFYHFGIAKALLDAGLLPRVITGTSGGALVAALLATRTDDELKRLIVPALAHRITACHGSTWTWFKRWWKTGARFDSVDWARRCSWFTRGSMTFREAYKRTGRILNISCVPSDPHSPTILANYRTSPDCVIWSAVLASAAVPGILNPVVLMKKNRSGQLEPYSFGHKWKDGSLRTDIPLKALNLHFNVNFTIVSQVNPHINLFFFSSRGTVGRPVTHRRGRGWRGGYLGSSIEQMLKLDMTKWLKVLRHLELLPRPMNQDWSQLWLQQFSGTITIWPKCVPSDFYYILSDPTPERLARMIRQGEKATWPKLQFIGSRMKLERIIERGRRTGRPPHAIAAAHDHIDLPLLSSAAHSEDEADVSRIPQIEIPDSPSMNTSAPTSPDQTTPLLTSPNSATSRTPALARMRAWFSGSKPATCASSPLQQDSAAAASSSSLLLTPNARSIYNSSPAARRESVLLEVQRQCSILYDDDDFEAESSGPESDADHDYNQDHNISEERPKLGKERDSWAQPKGGEWANIDQDVSASDIEHDARGSHSDENNVGLTLSTTGESESESESESEIDKEEKLRRTVAGPTVVG